MTACNEMIENRHGPPDLVVYFSAVPSRVRQAVVRHRLLLQLLLEIYKIFMEMGVLRQQRKIIHRHRLLRYLAFRVRSRQQRGLCGSIPYWVGPKVVTPTGSCKFLSILSLLYFDKRGFSPRPFLNFRYQRHHRTSRFPRWPTNGEAELSFPTLNSSLRSTYVVCYLLP